LGSSFPLIRPQADTVRRRVDVASTGRNIADSLRRC